MSENTRKASTSVQLGGGFIFIGVALFAFNFYNSLKR